MIFAALSVLLLMVPIQIEQWFPVQVGQRWVYEVESLSGHRGHPDVLKYREEVKVVRIEKVADGLLVKRSVRVLDHPEAARQDPSFRPESNVLLHEGCLYLDYETKYKLSETLADVCFPLAVGKSWGDAKKGRFLWTVTGYGRRNDGDPVSANSKGFRLEAELSSGDRNFVWFEKGVGVVGMRVVHDGTYRDCRVRLVAASFRPQ